jgi:hypothetical protein
VAADNTTETFTLKFGDKISGPSKKAADAIGALEKKIASQTSALAQLERQQSALGPRTDENAKKFDSLGQRIARMQSSIGGSRGKLGQLTTEFARNHTGLRGLIARYSEVPGPLGEMARGAGGLLETLSSTPLVLGAVAAGAVAVAAAVVAAGVAAAAAAVSFAAFAFSQADARRAELLHLEGLATLRTAYQQQTTTGAALQASIDRVADSSALARAAIAREAEGLHRAGLRGAALTTALEAVTTAQSVQGDRGASRIRAQVVGMTHLRQSIDGVAARVRSQLGPIAERQALTWDRQMQRLHESIGQLFDGLHLEGVLSVVHEVISGFSQSTTTGRGLRAVISAMFSGFGNDATSAVAAVHHGFALMVNGALRVTVAVLRVRNAIRDAFREGGAAASGAAFGAMLARGVTSIDWPAVGASVTRGILTGLRNSILAIGFVQDTILSFIGGLIVEIGSRSITAGQSMIDGVIGGIESRRDALIGSLASMAQSAVGSLASALQIRSPSRVFARLGREIPRGLAAGVASEPAAESAVGAMSERLATQPEGGGAVANTSSTSVGPFYIQAAPGTTAEQSEEIAHQIATILEGIALRRGAAPA